MEANRNFGRKKIKKRKDPNPWLKLNIHPITGFNMFAYANRHGNEDIKNQEKNKWYE